MKDGFIPLFNGVDLTGWTGDTAGYHAEKGILVANPKDNLYTKAEYGDFILRFEFKLTPEANNGIGVRVPMGKRASSEGFEVQIFDNSAEKFAELKPWQRHGSVYGVVPAKTGYLKPTGEWNEEEICVEGTRVRVTLNGAVILDTDLAPYRDGVPAPDGKDHPGLKRTRGAPVPRGTQHPPLLPESAHQAAVGASAENEDRHVASGGGVRAVRVEAAAADGAQRPDTVMWSRGTPAPASWRTLASQRSRQRSLPGQAEVLETLCHLGRDFVAARGRPMGR